MRNVRRLAFAVLAALAVLVALPAAAAASPRFKATRPAQTSAQASRPTLRRFPARPMVRPAAPSVQRQRIPLQRLRPARVRMVMRHPLPRPRPQAMPARR